MRSAAQCNLTVKDVEAFIDYLCKVAKHVDIAYNWRPFLKDPNDEMVLETAVAGGCGHIVTFNTGDFAGAEQFGIGIVRPREFLALIGENT